MDDTTIEPGVTPKTAKRVTDERDRALYVISVAAELAGVHPQTLRMYERKGLLRPARTEGRARRYSQRDIEHVRLIQQLTQEHGMSLAGAAMFMSMTRELEDMHERMEQMRAEVERVRREAERRVDEVRRSMRFDLVPVRKDLVRRARRDERPWDAFTKER